MTTTFKKIDESASYETFKKEFVLPSKDVKVETPAKPESPKFDTDKTKSSADANIPSKVEVKRPSESRSIEQFKNDLDSKLASIKDVKVETPAKPEAIDFNTDKTKSSADANVPTAK